MNYSRNGIIKFNLCYKLLFTHSLTGMAEVPGTSEECELEIKNLDATGSVAATPLARLQNLLPSL